jgi:hypothetical protein
MHRALSVAEGALRLCRATKPRLPGTEARILEHIATIHVKNHSFDRAITFYEEPCKLRARPATYSASEGRITASALLIRSAENSAERSSTHTKRWRCTPLNTTRPF